MKKALIQKLWKDPVWSKVIAGVIFFVLSQISIFIWGWISALPLTDIYKLIFGFLTKDHPVSTLSIILLLTILTILLTQQSKKGEAYLIDQNTHKEKHPPDELKIKTKNKDLRLVMTEEPTVFFDKRFCDAFPGIQPNTYQWFTKSQDIQQRLSILLAYPTKFDDAEGYGRTSDPIWWYRGYSAMYINNFKILDREKVLINIDEYIIEKMAAKRGRSYYDHFIYIQCKADKPTGLYSITDEKIKTYSEDLGHYFEEYGIYQGRFITRQECEDGSAIIKGKPVKVDGAILRSRSLVKYNFIITSKFSPYNTDEFYDKSEYYFKKLLIEEIQFDDFVLWMTKFRKHSLDQ